MGHGRGGMQAHGGGLGPGNRRGTTACFLGCARSLMEEVFMKIYTV